MSRDGLNLYPLDKALNQHVASPGMARHSMDRLGPDRSGLVGQGLRKQHGEVVSMASLCCSQREQCDLAGLAMALRGIPGNGSSWQDRARESDSRVCT